MVVSLYICEIPKNVLKKDMEELFRVMEGYIETRMKNTNDRRKIAFIDYQSENDARFALNTYQGFKFSQDDRGLIIKFSDNTKTGQSQPKKEREEFLNRKRKHSGDRSTRNKYRSHSNDNSSERDDDSSGINNNQNNIGNFTMPNNNQVSSLQAGTNLQNPNNLIDLINLLSSNSNLNQNSSAQLIKNAINPLNPSISNPNLLMQQHQDQNNNLNLHQGNLANIPGLNQNLGVMNTNNPSLGNTGSSEPSNNNYNNLLEILQNIQTVQLLNSLTSQTAASQNFNQSNPDSKNLQILNQSQNQNNPNSANALNLLSNHLIPIQTSNLNNNNQNQNNTSTSNSKSTSFLNSIHKYDDKFKNFLDFKKNATNIVYVEGLPLNATEREVAHIFRPFPGFKSVRLITRDKSGEKSVICFADFDDILQSTICINTLQGYRFDKNDLVGLHFSYGVSKQKK